MILLIDNYDSFSYNLYQLLGTIYDGKLQVVRNDGIEADDIAELNPERIILSPGPGKPSEAGICEEVIKKYYDKLPILGVCLGHQAICEAFGGTIGYARQLMHGKTSNIKIEKDSALYKGVGDENSRICVGRYHSLALDPDTLPECLRITGLSDDGEVMSVEHKDYPVFGLQYHPESILTPKGLDILKNFIKM